MNRPDTVLPNGTRVRTHDTLDSTDGLFVEPEQIEARRAGTHGIIDGIVARHGGDVYRIRHLGAKVSAVYCYTEFELENGPGDHAKNAPPMAA